MPTRPRTDPDAPAGDMPQPDAPTPATVTLTVGYPHDEFAPFGKDDPDRGIVITRDGTDVPAGRVDDIKAAAKAADVTIREAN